MIEINKENLYQKFIVENMTARECASFFNVSERKIRRILSNFKIKKDQEIKININDLYNFYIAENHTLCETMKHFNISKTALNAKLRKSGIKKDKELIVKNNKSFKNKVDVDKDKLIDFYINKNLTIEETANKLNCSKKVLIRRLKEFEIKKSLRKRSENVFNSCEQKYGVKHPSQIEQFKEKMVETNSNKYGVPYACMREECRKYSGNNSKPNQKFAELLEQNNIEFEREFSLEKYSYDFKVGNYLFEINPSSFHNSTFSPVGNPKDKKYHQTKSIVAKENGFRCIHVWDWDDADKIVSTFLIEKECVYARNCSIRLVTKQDATLFIEKHHLQGYAKDNIRIGLFFNDELVSIMTFNKPRYNGKYQYELVRYCASKKVIGGAEKIFTYFVNNYHPQTIISYCDLSKFSGDIYDKLGFNHSKTPNPSKHWYNLKTKRHITDNLLRQKGFDKLFNANYGKGTSNEQLMLENGFVEIFDCGQATYIWKENN